MQPSRGKPNRDAFTSASPTLEALESRTLLAVLPVVSMEATGSPSENGELAELVISRDAVSAVPLKVKLGISGTAKNGKDYAKVPATVTIPANAASVALKIAAIDDGRTEAAETAVFTIISRANYQRGGQFTATLMIDDATYLAEDFFPLADGLRWDYVYAGDGISLPVYHEMAMTDDGPQWSRRSYDDEDETWQEETLTLQSNAAGISLVLQVEPDELTFFDPPELIFPANMAIGSSIEVAGSKTGTWNRTYTGIIKVIGLERVKLPAGTFTALKIQRTMDRQSDDWSSHDVETFWLVRGIGVVKIECVDKGISGGRRETDRWSQQLTCFSASDSPWQAQTPLSSARDAFAGGVIENQIYVFGGDGPEAANSKLISTERFDPTANEWSALADNTNYNGFGVDDIAGAVVDGKLYVFGATGGDTGATVNFVQEYDPGTNAWTSKASKPTPVDSAACAAYDGEIFVFGGVFNRQIEGDDHLTFTRRVEAYNPATDTWRFVTNMPEVRYLPAVAVLNGRAYVFGGSSSAFKLRLNTMAYDFASNTWTTKGLAPLPVGRIFPVAAAPPVVDAGICLIGGFEGSSKFAWATNRVDIFEPATNTWSTGPSLPKPVGNHLAVVAGGGLYVVGGLPFGDTGDADAVADVWLLPLMR